MSNAVSGYAGGKADTAHYDIVGTGKTGHAESVQITFDPAKVSYGQLLQVYFSVAHDPTQLNRQGPDTGTQYRSTIFPQNDEQAKVAAAPTSRSSTRRKVFDAPIVTTIEPGKAFYPAEDYHQNYLTLNPTSPTSSTTTCRRSRTSSGCSRPLSRRRCWSLRRTAELTCPVSWRAGSPPPRRRARRSTGSEPSRSAMVRATRSTRW